MTTLAPRPVLGTPDPWSFPVFERSVLSNSMVVRSAHLPGKPLAAASVILATGTDMDPVGREGLAALLGGLLDEGTTRRSSEAWASELDLLGVDWSIGADSTSLRVDVECPAASLTAALVLVAEAITTPALDPRAFERVVRQLVDSARSAESSPSTLAQLSHMTSLWTPDSRAYVPSRGDVTSLSAMALEDVAALAARLTPVGATLVVGGDLTGVDVDAAAEAAFGGWTSTSAAAARRSSSPSKAPRLLVVDRPELVQSELVLGAVSFTRSDPAWCPTQVATHVLGGSISSRLDAVMREGKGYTYGVSAHLVPGARRGAWVATGSVEASCTVEAVEDLYREVRRASTDLSAEEVSASATFLVATSPIRWEGPLAVVRQAAALVASGLEPSWVDSYLTGLAGVTREAATAALAALPLAAMSLTVVGDAEKHAERLAAVTGLPLEVR